MGVIKNGILGGVAGKVAGVVGARWKGVNYVRGYAVPANPQTEAQTRQRTKFKNLVAYAKTILVPVINEFWEFKSPNMSGYNSFIKANVSKVNAVSGIEKDVLVSEGNLQMILLEGIFASANAVALTFAPQGAGDGLPSDNVHITMYNKTRNVSYTVTNACLRSASSYNFPIPQAIGTDECILWVWASRGNGRTRYSSNSEGYDVV